MNDETPRRRKAECAIAVVVYLALCSAWRIGGGRFLIFEDLWQLLPVPALTADLGGALLDLHAQPPLLNLLFGLALKGRAWGIAPESSLGLLQLVAGGAAVAALACVASRLIRRTWWRRAALAVVLLNPYLYASVHVLFYTVWELLFLCALAVAAARFFERPSTRRAACVLAPALALVYTRSLFHPVWLAVVAAVVVHHARSRSPRAWRATAAVAVVVLALAAAWPVKNFARFGVAGFSSWAGYNVSRGLPVPIPEVMAAFERRNDIVPRPTAVAAAEAAIVPAFRGRPALDALTKPDGSPNWNHPAVIGASRILGARAREALRQAPHFLFLRAADYYANGYAVYEGRYVYSTRWAAELAAFPRWALAYERGVMLAFREYDPRATRITTGFALYFPVMLAVIVAALVRRRRPMDATARLAALLLFCAAWVLVMTLFVDGAEGNRMRFSTQPLWWLLLGVKSSHRHDREETAHVAT